MPDPQPDPVPPAPTPAHGATPADPATGPVPPSPPAAKPRIRPNPKPYNPGDWVTKTQRPDEPGGGLI